MNKHYFSRALFFFSTIFASVCNGQNPIITTIAGTGTTGYSGDGGPASASVLNVPFGMAADGLGNIYFADVYNYRVRKISRAGIITTVAGNGASGYDGDGGPATDAQIGFCYGLTFDLAGNLYIVDVGDHVVRKVNPAGIISTFAGNGTFSESGDGGPATDAAMESPYGVACDAAGNVYITDAAYNNIRKVNALGIISTISGNGSAGYSGDGGPATAATLNEPMAIKTDGAGNIYFADKDNNRIRKINSSGIISTIAGNGTGSFSGDGGAATAAGLFDPSYIDFDVAGNFYITDYDNERIRKVDVSGIITTIAGTGVLGYSGDGGDPLLAKIAQPQGIVIDAFNNLYFAESWDDRIRKISSGTYASSDSLSIDIDKLCSGLQITVLTTSSSPLSLKTYFGDGNTDSSVMATSLLGTKDMILLHSYLNPGTYSIKHILYNGTAAIDSVKYSYEYKLCKNFSLKFYYDANNNCIMDSGEPFIQLPVTTEVDSNGVAVDTISSTSGIYYTAFGNPGDIYTFHIISVPAGLEVTCPVSGLFSDTLQLSDNSATKYIGLYCTSGTAFDLAEYVNLIAGRHMAQGNILVNNSYCTVENPTLTMHISPKYVFAGSYPAPTTIAGNTITWDMAGVSATSFQPFVQFSLTIPTSTYLTPGDTVQSFYNVTPVIGDVDTLNNNNFKIDTIYGSFDPNEMSVSPEGNILAGTQLNYTINFENTGNDTAFNIYVMDTLSPNVDVSGLRVTAASAVMNTSITQYGAQSIVKFDFPGINLLDSAHHNQCNGMVMFNVNAKPGLPDGTTIFNHAGIFFDDNPVVMTDTVEDIICGSCTALTAKTITKPALTLYPNPATDMLIIKMDNGAYSSFIITNQVGQTVLQQALNGPLTHVDIKTLPTGLYYITLKGDNGTKVEKFAKM